ncbi:hypothetical protein DFH09DRAFT_1364143 [Mycena vulgaris]|nr:hypothetical protein DFH09DRAFT_1364143 [Mycena vulgaris]
MPSRPSPSPTSASLDYSSYNLCLTPQFDPLTHSSAPPIAHAAVPLMSHSVRAQMLIFSRRTSFLVYRYACYADSATTSADALPRASSYVSSTHTTPAPGPMPLRVAHAGQYEYDGESTDSESGGSARRSRSTHERFAHQRRICASKASNYEPRRIPRARPPYVDTPAHAGAWGSTLPPAAPAFVPDNAGGVGFAGVGVRAALDAVRAAPISSAAYSASFAPPRARDSSSHVRLRTVVLPHATLPRFLGIASVNSARDLEACGLLLGGTSQFAAFPHLIRAPFISLNQNLSFLFPLSAFFSVSTRRPGKSRFVVDTPLIPK